MSSTACRDPHLQTAVRSDHRPLWSRRRNRRQVRLGGTGLANQRPWGRAATR